MKQVSEHTKYQYPTDIIGIIKITQKHTMEMKNILNDSLAKKGRNHNGNYPMHKTESESTMYDKPGG